MCKEAGIYLFAAKIRIKLTLPYVYFRRMVNQLGVKNGNGRYFPHQK
jgi:hypothetical protein